MSDLCAQLTSPRRRRNDRPWRAGGAFDHHPPCLRPPSPPPPPPLPFPSVSPRPRAPRRRSLTPTQPHALSSTTQSVKDLPTIQDGPPPGGFPSVRFARRIPSTGPAGATVLAAAAAIMAFGFYRVGQGNRARRGVKAEKVARRAALFPVLQAEEDRRWVAAAAGAAVAEAEVMKGVPGWEAGKGVYSPGARWMPPASQYGSWGNG